MTAAAEAILPLLNNCRINFLIVLILGREVLILGRDVKEGRDERDRGDRRDSGDEKGCWGREGWEGRGQVWGSGRDCPHGSSRLQGQKKGGNVLIRNCSLFS